MDLTLLVLAAGLGSRFGGAKQLAEVGPNGEALLDYTLDDARAAGFARVVLIVRSDLEGLVAEHLARRQPAELDYELVAQDADELAPPRARPWGTAHAVLAARRALHTPFAVVNADDYYGPSAFAQLADAFAADERAGSERSWLVAYRLARTLSPAGPVSRGVCEVGEDGSLRRITEQLALRRGDDGAIRNESGEVFAPDSLVSMNLWGLRPALLEPLEAAFEVFAARHREDPKAEHQLPTALDELARAGLTTVRVVPTEERWIGITYAEDLAEASARLADLRRSPSDRAAS
ncbi:MAG: NDP-sugar synthase [Acidimicrobiales bacterium]